VGSIDGNPIGVVGGAAAGFVGNYDCISTVTNAVTGAFSASSPNDSFYNGMGDSGWTGGPSGGDH
ncbi:hypothetical protein, partial [Elstera litoralis]|uniref:hypothetical protein n=1 Tax=Elstera litoralis TaxID=552518 RepID=UPI001E64C67D